MNNNMKKIFFLLVGLVCSIGCFAQGVEDDLYDTSEFAAMAHLGVLFLGEGRECIMLPKMFNVEEKLSRMNSLHKKVENIIEACHRYTQKFRKDNIGLEGYTKGEIRNMKKEAENDIYSKLSDLKGEVSSIKSEIQQRIRGNMAINSMFFNIY